MRVPRIRRSNMKAMHIPTGLVLVGILLFCIFPGLGAANLYSNTSERYNELKESYSDPLFHQTGEDLSQLKLPDGTIYDPWASRKTSGPVRPGLASDPASYPTREELILDASSSHANVQELSALNSIKQRDLICRDRQKGNGDSRAVQNALDVKVTGKEGGEREAGDAWTAAGFEELDVEDLVSSRLPASAENGVNQAREPGWDGTLPAGNYLDVDVSGIHVNAINTVEGGSAVATSNIIISPVQIIVCPSEVEAKLG